MFSQRFDLAVVLTAYARERMATRDMDEAFPLDIIAEDGPVVEIVLLEAKEQGLLPLEFKKAA